MAFTEFTVRSGGSNLYAGSLDGSAEAATTPLVSYTNGGWNSGTGVFTPASGDPVADGVAVGHWVSVYTDGAAAPTGFVARVTARTTTTITLSTTAKSGTAPTTGASGLTAVVGGAWAGPSGTSGFPFGFVQNTMTDASSNPPRTNFKNDQTYSVTAAMTHGNNGPMLFEGYTSAFGDGGRATIDGGTSGASYVPLTVPGSPVRISNFVVQNNGASGSAAGLLITGRGVLYRCVVRDVRGHGFSIIWDQSWAVECEAFGCNQSNTASTAGFNLSTGGCERCVAHDNTGSNTIGFLLGSGVTLIDCIADTNGSHGAQTTGFSGFRITGFSSYNNGGSGVKVGSAGISLTVSNSVLVNNAAYGVDGTSATASAVLLQNNAFYNNTSGQTNGVNASNVFGSITLTGDPFTDAANGDFRLNNTSGAGAACRGTGIGAFTQTASGYSGTVGYPDVGAAQHQETTTTVVVPCAQSVLMTGRAGVSAH